jgi:hypothetical protein
MKTKHISPSLGNTSREIWNAWKEIRAYPRQIIVGVVCGTGCFAFNSRGEMKVCERFKCSNGAYISTVREPTKAELDDLDEAIQRGWIQIESHMISGCTGTYVYSNAGQTVKVHHQATGKPLPEWLVTEAGLKWQDQEKVRESELLNRYPQLAE